MSSRKNFNIFKITDIRDPNLMAKNTRLPGNVEFDFMLTLMKPRHNFPNFDFAARFNVKLYNNTKQIYNLPSCFTGYFI